ncbi:MAG: ATP-binding protein [Myxococcota bacterium]
MNHSQPHISPLWRLSNDGILVLEGEQIVDANPVARALLSTPLSDIQAHVQGEQVFISVHNTPVTTGRLVSLGDGRAGALLSPSPKQRWALVNRGAGLGALLGGIIHELNNPLTFILTNVQMAADLLAEPELDAETIQDIEESIEDIRNGADRLRNLSVWLRALVRSERSTELASAQLDEAFTLGLRLMGTSLRARAQVFPQIDSVPAVPINEGALLQVCVNILLNAAAAMDIRTAQDNRLWVRVWSADGKVFGEVADNGPGIDPAIRDRIFEPFFSTTGGPGLGLTMVQNFIVERFGGMLSVADRVGGGTRVAFSLPITATRAAAPAPASAPQRRLLLVDDDDAVRRGLRRELRRHDLKEARSVAEAIALLAQDDRFDLILCDLLMPRQPGVILYDWLRDHRPTLASRLILMTGGELVPGAEDLLTRLPTEQRAIKPVTSRDVDQRIARLEIPRTKG